MATNFNYNYPQIARECGFKLRQYKDGPIDWRLVGCIEIERLLQDQRFEQLDPLLAHLAEAPIATLLDSNILDNGITKYFVVSQFAIQYLLFCRKYLDETISDLREAHATAQMDVAKLRKSLTEANNEILQLNKKITQIEAIHEVVYPCHLCTKNFISNEALNIHISRRHALRGCGVVGVGGGAAGAERRSDTPASITTKEREHNDLQLINAVKLELEIKRLKERLNNAERNVRERRAAISNSRHATPREPQKVLKSIAVQSELQETKEQDDEAHDTAENSNVQLNQLQSKIQELKTWRQTEQHNNEESIAEINRKLNEIARTLEQTKTLHISPLATIDSSGDDQNSDKHGSSDPHNAATLERPRSPSVEDIERLLSEKVVEIGQKSAERLEEFVQNMETNYMEKLEQLEREIKKCYSAQLNRMNDLNTPQTEASSVPPERSSVPPASGDARPSACQSKPEPAKRISLLNPGPFAEPKINAMDKAKTNDETYVMSKPNRFSAVMFPQPRQRDIKSQNKSLKSNELLSQSTESNRTFVKAVEKVGVKDREHQKLLKYDNDDDSEDVTDSLNSESESGSGSGSDSSTSMSSSISREETEKMTAKAEKIKRKPSILRKSRDLKKPKKFTRTDALQIMNERLIVSGLDPKAKGISAVEIKYPSTGITDQRHKLKQKYPKFYATRNKIKKLVDRLCSKKPPPAIEDMAKDQKPTNAKTNVIIQNRDDDVISETELSSDQDSLKAVEDASTPLQLEHNQHRNDDLKQRLDRILALPVLRPSDFEEELVNAEKLPEDGSKVGATYAPVPLTRKRVMFNSPTATEVRTTRDADLAKPTISR